MSDKVNMAIEIDGEIETQINAVMEALSPVCRDPENPEVFDGRRAVEILGACAAMIFAGIPEAFRESQVEPWLQFVRDGAMNIEAGKMHTIKVSPGQSRAQCMA